MSKRMLQFRRVGDFHEAYGEDAEIIARELGLTLTTRDGAAAVGVPYHGMERAMHDLCTAGYMVEANAPDRFFQPSQSAKG